MRRTRIGVAGIALLTAAAIGESMAFIGGMMSSSGLVWFGHAVFLAGVLFVLAKLLRVRRDATNTIVGPDTVTVVEGEEESAMFDHVKFGVSDYAASKAFFIKALEPLGVIVVAEGVPTYGIELSRPGGKDSLCLFQTRDRPIPLHIAFVAGSRGQVGAFYRAALEAGGKDNGAPGLRPQYHPSYYAAFVIGPDGHNIEAVCHNSE